MSGVTVIGLVPGSFTIEDIRIVVPHREAIQIPAHLVQRSKDLSLALQQQRIMQLGSRLPIPPSKVPPLAASLRGRGIAPHLPVPKKQDPWPRDREAMVRELESSRAQTSQFQSINESLQAALASMTGQLTQIQQTLNGLGLPREGRVQSSSPAPQASLEVQEESSPVEAPVPHFVMPTTKEQAEVRISIPEKTSDSDLTGVRGALRSLRDKAPGKL